MTLPNLSAWQAAATPGFSPAVLSVRCHHRLEGDGLAQVWQRLSLVAPRAGLANSLPWCRCWLEVAGPRALPMILEVVGRTGEAVGLWPLLLEQRGSARWLRPSGPVLGFRDEADLLALPGTAEACWQAIVRWLDKERAAYDGLILPDLDPASLAVPVLKEWAQRRGHAWRLRATSSVFSVSLRSPIDLNLPSPIYGSLMQHSPVGVTDHAKGSIEVVPIHDAPGLIEALECLHPSEIEQADGSGARADQDALRFRADVSLEAQRQGWLRGWILKRSGRGVTVLLALHHREQAMLGWWHAEGNPHAPAMPVELWRTWVAQARSERLSECRLQDAAHWPGDPSDGRSRPRATLTIGCALSAKAGLIVQRVRDALRATFGH